MAITGSQPDIPGFGFWFRHKRREGPDPVTGGPGMGAAGIEDFVSEDFLGILARKGLE